MADTKKRVHLAGLLYDSHNEEVRDKLMLYLQKPGPNNQLQKV